MCTITFQIKVDMSTEYLTVYIAVLGYFLSTKLFLKIFDISIIIIPHQAFTLIHSRYFFIWNGKYLQLIHRVIVKNYLFVYILLHIFVISGFINRYDQLKLTIGLFYRNPTEFYNLALWQQRYKQILFNNNNNQCSKKFFKILYQF